MTTDDLLTTQQAATLLGCSRQHVVNLCTSGRLPYTRIGSHRRIRRGDLEAFARTKARPLRREELRSLWLHRAVAGKVVQDPDRAIAVARRNVRRFRAINPHAATWLDAWARILDEGPDAVLDVLTSPSRQAVDLRQNTPFVGLLSDMEQRAVIDAFTAAHRDRVAEAS
ncbi:MAG: helix-turn-helix domain-containing protein [Chloroflexota bacterium]